MRETTAEDVPDLFCTSAATQKRFEDWRNDPRRTEVAPMVMAHRTRVLYRLTEQDVRDVCRHTEHALGDVRRTDGESVRQIVDWHPDYAFTHTFHICVERIGEVPTYQQSRPEQLLADLLPPLRFDTVELEAATTFGQVHVPTPVHLDQAAARLSPSSEVWPH